MAALSASERSARLRSLWAPGLATLVCLAILLGLGVWQLARKGEKEALIARIIERSHAEPPATPPPFDAWDAKADEFNRVRARGTFLHDRETLVHGLAPGEPGRALQGFYVLTPLKRDDGTTILINRGFIPTELKRPEDRAAGQVTGEATVTGMLRASEARGLFVPESDPKRDAWFTRDIAGIAAARELTNVAPYLIEADATPNPGGWPRGGQLRVDLPNNHLQYAFTWFGIAACLIGVFSVFAWRRLHDPAEPKAG
ncbi:Surfeit locus 1 family protein [Methylorubrum populi BJ001]|uniref:SURF1-like protein n=1 Tax=Methylorubrum populi (strain ATCC BAA-705 / NCIMB 13946 / BJ001) TaxID=441620 RepID=B1ZKN3_METPB|nr:SURF1 family protein [Methylorubrum populi]ACB81603.1 Surfeit locus 1 family protein [Methylorubrum populi BJ001]OAH34814.1 surfeit 1 [Methylorubrum populi]PZP72592.1 MAG: SURF1 family protein [Methylorubrum populi]